MAIINNFLDLGQIYKDADQYRANNQQATLRDLQITDTQRKQQQEMALEDLARQSTDAEGNVDWDRFSREAVRSGNWRAGSDIRDRQSAFKQKEFERIKRGQEFKGQLAYIPDAPPEQREGLWQSALQEIEKFDPALAKQMREADPNYTDATGKKLRQLQMQAISPYQREQLRIQEEKMSLMLRKLEKASQGTLKSSDTNTLLRLAATMTGSPFTEDAMGNISLTATDPQMVRKIMSVVEHASAFLMQDPTRQHAAAVANAMRKLRSDGTFDLPDIPAPAGMTPGGTPNPANPAAPPPGGFKPISDQDKADAIRAYSIPGQRAEVLRRFKQLGYDPSILQQVGSDGAPQAPGVTLPKSTVSPSKPLIRVGPGSPAGGWEAVKEQRDIQVKISGNRRLIDQLKNELTKSPSESRQSAIIRDLQQLGAELQSLQTREQELVDKYNSGGQ